jgi:putative flippase GtrA
VSDDPRSETAGGAGLRSEALRFGLVGIAGTMVHVTVCLLVAASFTIRSELANLAGFLAAVLVSYVGHSQYTFGVKSEHRFQMPRFAALSLTGLLVSSAITWGVCTRFGGPIWLAMALTVVTVPTVTFIGAKFWVFASRQRMPDA